MIITLQQPYKSLTPFTSEELGNFVLITGTNGSGKTQLLELLKTLPQNNETNPKATPINCDSKIKSVQDVVGQVEMDAINSASVIQQKSQFYSDILQLEGIRLILDKFIQRGINFNKIDKDLIQNGFNDLNGETRASIYRLMQKRGVYGEYTLDTVVLFIVSRISELRKPIEVALELAKNKRKKVSELSDTDFHTATVSEGYFAQLSGFQIALNRIFIEYASNREENLKAFHYEYSFMGQQPTPPKEFENKFPAPWKKINSALEKINSRLRVNGIESKDYHPHRSYPITFYNDETNATIYPQDFSSGEKVIIGLVISLFASDTYSSTMNFPDMVVLDEPDAYLHPGYCQLMLNVLQDMFVKEHGIKVIITTHSPTTVALAPEESIYELQNGTNSGLRKITKDEALKILTTGIPILSIDYKNQKQVLTESPTDCKYYQYVYNAIKRVKPELRGLYFIPSGSYGNGNCDRVIDLIKGFRDAGNNSVLGVIDWDKKNERTSNYYVHGEGRRYSIENFLFDPIYIVSLLIKNGLRDGVNNLGFTESYDEYSIGEDSNENLQRYADWVISQLPPKYQTGEKQDVKYQNHKRISLPRTYLFEKGHDIKPCLQTAFPFIDGLRRKEEYALEKELSKIIAKCYPFIPVETYELIIDLAE